MISPGKILVVASAPFFPIDGATRSMFERLELLRALYGWEARVACTGRIEHREDLARVARQFDDDAALGDATLKFAIMGTPVEMLMGAAFDRFSGSPIDNFNFAFRTAVEDFQPSIVMGNLRDTPALVFLVTQASDRHLLFLTEDEFPRPSNLKKDPRFLPNKNTFTSIRRVAVASRYLQSSFKSAWGIEPEVFTNAIQTERYEIKEHTADECVSMFHPRAHKGVSIFLDVAKAMPKRKFLLAGGLGAEYRAMIPALERLPNLTHLPFQTDVRPIYSASKIVLVPSLWEEAFSRVVIEALASGTPVIASNTGGITEAGGEAVNYLDVRKMQADNEVPPQNIKPWLKAIKLFDDPDIYGEQVVKARRRIEQFKIELSHSMERMHRYLLSIVS